MWFQTAAVDKMLHAAARRVMFLGGVFDELKGAPEGGVKHTGFDPGGRKSASLGAKDDSLPSAQPLFQTPSPISACSESLQSGSSRNH